MSALELAESIGVAITGALAVIWLALAAVRRLGVDLNAPIEPPAPPSGPSYVRVPLDDLVWRANAPFGVPPTGARPDLSSRPVREES